ncbi:Fic family protein [Sulfuricurvum sp.]|uniref:Fic family protein n=1 Tax=Sulfuricurvum sp. TaxID=2025608 RepID=UPI002602777E|nr:Fic family protein [Sulfuricurvum sp.]MDD3595278.1 Fic family protein [Sulfuricurvum sp.]
MKRWIWEQEAYPHFIYDLNRLERLIQEVSLEQGYLIAMTKTMDSDNIAQRQLEALISEAISTSAIEGEILNRDSVKASIARKLGLSGIDTSKCDESTDYLIEILIDANTNYDKTLTLERLFGWHNALFPRGYSGLSKINVATFRGEETMEVIGGAAGKEKTYYVAPPRSILEDEMERYLQWFNATPPSLIKACIAHLWFVIIHPFDDGNGRIGRAITDLVLSKIEKSSISRLYSMSSAINNDRNGYYHALEKTTGYVHKESNHLDITQWCEWFLTTLHTALIDTKKKLNYIVQKTAFWDKYREYGLNPRQTKVLNKILDTGAENFQGSLSKKKYMTITDTASTTASRDITQLLEIGCIRQIEGTNGRNVRYEIVIEN